MRELTKTNGPVVCDETVVQDHVSRLIGKYFDVQDNELVVGGLPVSWLSDKFGTPSFIYDKSAIVKRIEQVKSMLPSSFRLYYSVKANPNAMLLKTFVRKACGLEVASAGELFQAVNAGCLPQRIVFAGPGKTRSELAAAVHAGIREVHVESVEEARCLNELAGTGNRSVNVALRVNPTEPAGGAMLMGGKASPFGIDEEDLGEAIREIASLTRLRVVGIHIFMATQVLDAGLLIDQYRAALQIAREVAHQTQIPLKTIDFGGGWGTPYFSHETELDLQKVRDGLAAIAAQMKSDPLLASAQGIIEPGRFLINEAGLYLARVTRVKKSRGKFFAIIDGGMHHHLAASGNLGQTIKRNYPVAIVNKLGMAPCQVANVVGPLCTPLDILARQARFPTIEAGDLFAVFQSGAYARTASPHGFLSHDAPAEVLAENGTARLIRRGGMPSDSLRDQIELVQEESTETIGL